MKKKSLFSLLIIMVIVAFVGLGLTITLAVLKICSSVNPSSVFARVTVG